MSIKWYSNGSTKDQISYQMLSFRLIQFISCDSRGNFPGWWESSPRIARHGGEPLKVACALRMPRHPLFLEKGCDLNYLNIFESDFFKEENLERCWKTFQAISLENIFRGRECHRTSYASWEALANMPGL